MEHLRAHTAAPRRQRPWHHLAVPPAQPRNANSWLADRPGGNLVYRDLVLVTLPMICGGWVSAAFRHPGSHDTAARLALSRSDALIAELLAADAVVLGAPLHSLSVPVALKAWIDLVARAGKTFVYTETGVRGLLSGKRVIVVGTSGSDPAMLAAIGNGAPRVPSAGARDRHGVTC